MTQLPRDHDRDSRLRRSHSEPRAVNRRGTIERRDQVGADPMDRAITKKEEVRLEWLVPCGSAREATRRSRPQQPCADHGSPSGLSDWGQ
jgi:hypothetical protein